MRTAGDFQREIWTQAWTGCCWTTTASLDGSVARMPAMPLASAAAAAAAAAASSVPVTC